MGMARLCVDRLPGRPPPPPPVICWSVRKFHCPARRIYSLIRGYYGHRDRNESTTRVSACRSDYRGEFSPHPLTSIESVASGYFSRDCAFVVRFVSRTAFQRAWDSSRCISSVCGRLCSAKRHASISCIAASWRRRAWARRCDQHRCQR